MSHFYDLLFGKYETSLFQMYNAESKMPKPSQPLSVSNKSSVSS